MLSNIGAKYERPIPEYKTTGKEGQNCDGVCPTVKYESSSALEEQEDPRGEQVQGSRHPGTGRPRRLERYRKISADDWCWIEMRGRKVDRYLKEEKELTSGRTLLGP